MNLMRRSMYVIIGILITVSFVACAELYGSRRTRYSSSVVDYLYPKKEVVEVSSIPRLSLPLRVGVAFVPGSGGKSGESHLSEKDKMDLMNRISTEFRRLPFVKEIELIPSAYLTPGGGFTNLDQVKTMYGIDVIALLSYDQVQHTDEGLLSITYWTLVGAYVIKGEKNDTSTMLDAAVYDITSRKMLFRAPGTSHIRGSATLVNLTEQLRVDSLNGFHAASDELVLNLQNQLEQFKAKVKEQPQEYAVEHKPGYTGGGSIGGCFALVVLGLGGFALWRSKRRAV